MSKPRILLVDDDHEFLRRFLLLGEEHFDLKTATDGSSALRAVAEDPFDAVLLDVDLGKGLSGIDVLTRLRQEARDVPVIMVSGDETPSTIVAAIRAGASDYISKRPNLELLRVKIEAALRDVAWRVHARSMQRSAMSSWSVAAPRCSQCVKRSSARAG
ncbi:MAG: response regulator [Acidobacteria bacterium]|nr:response regulator [Acidobacteriota bacterium]